VQPFFSMHYCYIIYSQSANRFYVGETNNFLRRLEENNSHFFKSSFSSVANDWVEYLIFELPDITAARALEKHIKKMKSRKFIERLKTDIEFRISIVNEIQFGIRVLVPTGRICVNLTTNLMLKRRAF
jgi:putative endonuclease